MSPREDDVPSGIDLKDPRDAATWVAEADVKRPWRARVRATIAELVDGRRRVLELGSGPGLLAEAILDRRHDDTIEYTMFDFSPPMLAMSRARIGERAKYLEGDYARDGWSAVFGGARFDAVVAMQAVHEVRHKRHVPRLYREIRDRVIAGGGVFVVCDHEPSGTMNTSLHSTVDEQLAAFAAGGFTGARLHSMIEGLYICIGIATGSSR